jgi:hypothetical protein
MVRVADLKIVDKYGITPEKSIEVLDLTDIGSSHCLSNLSKR